MDSISATFGALLIGGIIAAVFSGIVAVQAFVYSKFYPSDAVSLKSLVSVVWLIDVLHTIFVSMSLWDHFIVYFGKAGRIDYIPWSLAWTIALTAILTFLVHCFYVHRIFKLSFRNYYLSVPLGIIATLRLAFALLTTGKMIELKSLALFVDGWKWSFTCGLALSSLMDVLITGSLCYFLMAGRRKNANPSIHHVLDTLMLYAFENGSLTCVTTIVSMICWLAMDNLIFMALHFVISKFYANSLLATLNTRKILNGGYNSQTSGDRVNIPIYDSNLRRISRSPLKHGSDPRPIPGHVQIKVEEMTLRTVDCGDLTYNGERSPTTDRESNKSQTNSLA